MRPGPGARELLVLPRNRGSLEGEREGEREGAETRGRRRGQGRSAEAGVSAGRLAGLGGLPRPRWSPGDPPARAPTHPSGHGTPRPARHVALRHDQA